MSTHGICNIYVCILIFNILNFMKFQLIKNMFKKRKKKIDSPTSQSDLRVYLVTWIVDLIDSISKRFQIVLYLVNILVRLLYLKIKCQ